MSRNGRGIVEHDASRVRSAVANMPEGVSRALNKVKEDNYEQPLEERQAEKPQVPFGLKDLILFGKISEDVKIGPYTFKIGTLSNNQQRDIFKRLFSMSNEDKIVNLKPYTLAEAILSVNGAGLEELYTGNDFSLSVTKKKEYVIAQLQSTLVDKLYTKYEEISKKSNDILSGDGISDDIKN